MCHIFGTPCIAGNTNCDPIVDQIKSLSGSLLALLGFTIHPNDYCRRGWSKHVAGAE